MSLGPGGADGRYSGWIGTVAAVATSEDGRKEEEPTLEDAARRLAAVAGTSTCHLVQSKEGVMVPGVVSSQPSSLLTLSGGHIAMPCSLGTG